MGQQISIHAPPRGATLLCCVCRSPRRFQFTPLREGRHVFAKAATSSNTFQFTPLREGRHKAPSALVQLAISIHAPPRGATRSASAGDLSIVISIHAPPRGATVMLHLVHNARYLISIHAPPRGATFNRRYSRQSKCISIHAPPRGATGFGAQRIHRMLFQFTPLREGRRATLHEASPPTSFQFTPLREGRRRQRYTAANAESISIHAPPRGATAKDMQFLQIFCSTLTNQHGLTIMPRNLSRLFW